MLVSLALILLAAGLAAGGLVTAPPTHCPADPRCAEAGTMLSVLDEDERLLLEVCECDELWFAILTAWPPSATGRCELQAFVPIPLGATEQWTRFCDAEGETPGLVLGVVDLRDCGDGQRPRAAWSVDVGARSFRVLDIRDVTCWVDVPEYWDCEDVLEFQLGCDESRRDRSRHAGARSRLVRSGPSAPGVPLANEVEG